MGHDERVLARAAWRAQRIAFERDLGRRIRHGVGGPARISWREPLLIGLDRMASRLGMRRLGVRLASGFVISRHDIAVPGLPAPFDGYRILHLSDLHADIVPGAVEAVARRLAGEAFDLVALTGDYQTDHGPPLPEVYAGIGHALAMLAPVDGAFAVLGNHDHHDTPEALEAQGVTLLLNERSVIGRGGASLSLVGTDDVHAFCSAAALALLGAPAPGPSVALVHSPEAADIAAAAGHALYLCGHTHGGQICLPGGRPLVTVLERHRDLASGRWRLGGMQGFTNRGLGASVPPIRLNCPAEAAVLTLIRQS
ncbi:metallophosphoesterase [Magnetospirillum sp. UT-4]|uniref:metallophosphoesterase n=1 Tax=Magnetospirillum sp. UT-4 TaxID=2681467 RepID=UPI00138552DE|nr:metallophosphoesterase [Magnetospirillum sp. UT-4]CAA7618855.1 Predicted phosphohydrolase [Magnetospirillum sp. UT-4]